MTAASCIMRRSFAVLLIGAAISGAPFTALPACAQGAAGPSAATPSISDHVAEASRRFGVPEAWIWAVMRVESAGDVGATSHAGAMGLMQVMPPTYAELRARYGLGPNPYDPRDNILAGTAYLREMHDRYGAPGFLAAYNAGPGRYEQHLAGRPLPLETRAYLARLAPQVGGASTAAAAMPPTAPDPLAWRRAALFAGRWGASDPVATGSADASPDVRVTPVSATIDAPSHRRLDGLFVPLSGPRQ